MAEQTTNLGLTKPDAAEGYDINVFNTNADIVDGAVGALLNELGGSGSGLGGKVDALQASMTAARSEISAVKTDTEALAQALATANQNINTLLTTRGSVKEIIAGTSVTPATLTIPPRMNPDKVVVLISFMALSGSSWTKTGSTVKVESNAATGFTFQLVEFY